MSPNDKKYLDLLYRSSNFLDGIVGEGVRAAFRRIVELESENGTLKSENENLRIDGDYWKKKYERTLEKRPW